MNVFLSWLIVKWVRRWWQSHQGLVVERFKRSWFSMAQSLETSPSVVSKANDIQSLPVLVSVPILTPRHSPLMRERSEWGEFEMCVCWRERGAGLPTDASPFQSHGFSCGRPERDGGTSDKGWLVSVRCFVYCVVKIAKNCNYFTCLCSRLVIFLLGGPLTVISS